MQRLEVSGAVRLIYRSLGVKGLNGISSFVVFWNAHNIINRAMTETGRPLSNEL
jgi:hypothetical protein